MGAVNESNSSNTSFLGTVFSVDAAGLIVVVLDSVVVEDVVVELLLMGSVSFLSEGLYSVTRKKIKVNQNQARSKIVSS